MSAITLTRSLYSNEFVEVVKEIAERERDKLIDQFLPTQDPQIDQLNELIAFCDQCEFDNGYARYWIPDSISDTIDFVRSEALERIYPRH